MIEPDAMQQVMCPYCQGRYLRCPTCNTWLELDDCQSVECDDDTCTVRCPTCYENLPGDKFEMQLELF